MLLPFGCSRSGCSTGFLGIIFFSVFSSFFASSLVSIFSSEPLLHSILFLLPHQNFSSLLQSLFLCRLQRLPVPSDLIHFPIAECDPTPDQDQDKKKQSDTCCFLMFLEPFHSFFLKNTNLFCRTTSAAFISSSDGLCPCCRILHPFLLIMPGCFRS